MEIADALHLAKELRDENAPDWRVKLFRSKHRAGYASYNSKIIGLSIDFILILPEAEVRNIILHELGHTIVGPKHKHDLEYLGYLYLV